MYLEVQGHSVQGLGFRVQGLGFRVQGDSSSIEILRWVTVKEFNSSYYTNSS